MVCKKKWFTLIELMIVLIVLGILVAAAVPIYRSVVGRAYETEILSALGVVRTAQQLYRAQEEAWPADKAALEGQGLLDEDDFDDMVYLDYSELSVEGGGVSKWTKGAGSWPSDLRLTSVTMAVDGSYTRSTAP